MEAVKQGDFLKFLKETGVMGPFFGDTGIVIEVDRHILTVHWSGGAVTLEELSGRNDDWCITTLKETGHYSAWWCEETV